MNTFLWTVVIGWGISALANAYWVAMRDAPVPLSPGARAICVLVDIALIVWALKLLGVL